MLSHSLSLSLSLPSLPPSLPPSVPPPLPPSPPNLFSLSFAHADLRQSNRDSLRVLLKGWLECNGPGPLRRPWTGQRPCLRGRFLMFQVAKIRVESAFECFRPQPAPSAPRYGVAPKQNKKRKLFLMLLSLNFVRSLCTDSDNSYSRRLQVDLKTCTKVTVWMN